MAHRLFKYRDDIANEFGPNGPSITERVRQSFDPRRLATEIMLEFQRACNTYIDLKEMSKNYNLKYDKIIAFRFNDMQLKPFFFTCNGGRVFIVSNVDEYHTLITSDLKTVLNILHGKVSLEQARRDNRVVLRGDRIGHDEALFLEIFKKVAPMISQKLKIGGN